MPVLGIGLNPKQAAPVPLGWPRGSPPSPSPLVGEGARRAGEGVGFPTTPARSRSGSPSLNQHRITICQLPFLARLEGQCPEQFVAFVYPVNTFFTAQGGFRLPVGTHITSRPRSGDEI